MIYLHNAKYKCKYCDAKFEYYAGYNSPRLIEHLIRKHDTKAKQYRDLYLSDVIKECFEFEGGTNS